MDKFSISMNPEEFINYIRKTPKQFVDQLPGKLEDWWKDKALKIALDKMKDYPMVLENTEEDKLRLEIATKVLVRHAPAATIDATLLADYCVEAADALLKRLKR